MPSPLSPFKRLSPVSNVYEAELEASRSHFPLPPPSAPLRVHQWCWAWSHTPPPRPCSATPPPSSLPLFPHNNYLYLNYLSRKALVGAYMHMMIYVDGSLCWHSWQFKEYLWICNWFQPINQSMNCWPLSSPFWGGVGVIEGQLEGRPRGEWRALKPNIIRIPQ